MNNCIFDNIINTLKKNDIFYFLGDIAFGKGYVIQTLEIIKETGATIHYIWGNHDKKYKNLIKPYCDSYKNYNEIKINDQFVILSHYAIEDWNGMTHGSICLHGHSHGTLPKRKNRFDVCVDGNDFKIISIDKILEMKEKVNG